MNQGKKLNWLFSFLASSWGEAGELYSVDAC